MRKNISLEKVQSMFVSAARLLQNGDAEGARKGLEKVAKLAPDSIAIKYNLGLAYQHLDKHHKAEIEFRNVLKKSPDNVDAVINLGLSQRELKQSEDATRSANRALKMAPGHPRALNLLGSISAEKGEFAEAEKAFKQSLQSDPSNGDARFNLANAVLQSGNAESALEIINPLVAQQPTKEQQELVGQILLELRRFDEVAKLLSDLKTKYPDDESVQILDMAFCELIKDHFNVVDKAQVILKKSPANPRIWNSLGSAYFQLDSVEKAMQSYQKAIDLEPDHPEYQNNIGLTFASLGNKDQAEKSYRQSIALNQNYAEAYRNLVAMKKFKSIDDEDAQMVLKLWEQSEIDDFTRCKLAFALGKIYDDSGLYDKAFEIYSIGNQLKSAEITMDFDQYFSHIDRIVEVFDHKPEQAVWTNESDMQPIFILGMPRSGTTLVEQIITRHPEVTGCGELPCIERAIGRLEKRYGAAMVYPNDFIRMDSTMFGHETQEYFNWVNRLHSISSDFFTDKMPFNFVHVWLIKSMFPNAAIAHCHRHPLDVITSNYFQLYGSEINFVYDLEIMAKYYVRYHRLMRHWHQVFDDELYKVQYEALVSNSEDETRVLIDRMGLQWSDACLDQKASGTAVRTASIWQVRQGIYTSSKERWRRYEKHLQPAIDVLVAEGVLDSEYRYVN